MPVRRAGSPIAVYAGVQCREPKTGQEKVQFYCKDDSHFLSSYYLSMGQGLSANIFYMKNENFAKVKSNFIFLSLLTNERAKDSNKNLQRLHFFGSKHPCFD